MKQEVIDALKKQKPWIQEAARRLLKNGTLSDNDVESFVEMIKNPAPQVGSSGAYPASESQTPSVLKIQSIGDVVGIDALGPRKPLDFGKNNLTVIYGANGSGKSGYARIITKACGASQSTEFKPDVFEKAAASKECNFKYALKGNDKSVTWDANAGPIPDFDSVNVFDTDNGRLYLEKDNELSYEIPELTVFSKLVSVCQRVGEKLKAEKEKLTSKLPQIPHKFQETTSGEVPLFAQKPDKALKALKDERLAQAKKIHDSDGFEAYRAFGKAICSDFRILLERVVENDFLADVILRHRRAIMTMGKVAKLAKISTSDCELIDKMMSKYSCHEHSQSGEAPGDLPLPEELQKDIQEMLDWHKEFSKRA